MGPDFDEDSEKASFHPGSDSGSSMLHRSMSPSGE